MGRAKYKPRVRRLKRAAIDAEKASIERWQSVAERFEPGTAIHSKAMANIKVAKLRLEDLEQWETP